MLLTGQVSQCFLQHCSLKYNHKTLLIKAKSTIEDLNLAIFSHLEQSCTAASSVEFSCDHHWRSPPLLPNDLELMVGWWPNLNQPSFLIFFILNQQICETWCITGIFQILQLKNGCPVWNFLLRTIRRLDKILPSEFYLVIKLG